MRAESLNGLGVRGALFVRRIIPVVVKPALRANQGLAFAADLDVGLTEVARALLAALVRLS